MSSTPIPKNFYNDDPNWDTVADLARVLMVTKIEAAKSLVEVTSHPCYLVSIRDGEVVSVLKAPSAKLRVRQQVAKESVGTKEWLLVPFSEWFADSPWNRDRFVYEWALKKDKTGLQFVMLCEEEIEEE